MTRTVALLGVTGRLGGALFAGLYVQHKLGAIRLIILHRATSNVSFVPADIEMRILDSENTTPEEVGTALEGVDVLILATAKVTPHGSMCFLRNLAASNANLLAFVPSWFTANWTPEEEESTRCRWTHDKAKLINEAKRLGLPVTRISCGLFASSFFNESFSGVDVKRNRLKLCCEALESTIGVTSLPYLGAAVGQIVASSDFGPGQQYMISEVQFTGQQLADVLASINGTLPIIHFVSDSEANAAHTREPYVALAAAWRHHWGKGRWTDKGRFIPKGVPIMSLEDIVDKCYDI